MVKSVKRILRLLTEERIVDEESLHTFLIEVEWRRSWRAVQWMANQFWKRWKREYLLLLEKRILASATTEMVTALSQPTGWRYCSDGR